MAARARGVKCVGGPWDGLTMQTKIPRGNSTLQIKVDTMVGRYSIRYDKAIWEPSE